MKVKSAESNVQRSESRVDLRELAIDRSAVSQQSFRTRQQMVTRYVLPGALLLGFLSLVAWAAREHVFPPQQVSVVPVVSTTAEHRQEGTPLFQAAGWIEPRPTPVRVAALAPGVVEQLLVVEDQAVKAGEPVAELVKDDSQLELERALANLKLREAELEEAESLRKAADTRFHQPVHLEAAWREAEASLAKIETELASLPFQIRRAAADRDAQQKGLDAKQAAKGVVANVAIEFAKSKLQSASALVEELHDRTTSLEKERDAQIARRDALRTQLELLAEETRAIEGSAAKVKAARARVEQARVAVAEAELQLDRMTVRSPIDARVYQLIAHPGTRLSAGMGHTGSHDSSTVVTLYRPDLLQVRVDVRFEDIPHVTLNQPVEFDNAALATRLSGKVLFISSEADIQKNTLQVKVEIPNPPTVLKPEMLVDVTFLAPQQRKSTPEMNRELKLFLPQQLVHEEDGRAFVWLADQSQGRARKQTIQTGMDGSQGLVEITAGLTIASRIISSGVEELQDGDRIEVIDEDSLPAATAALPQTD